MLLDYRFAYQAIINILEGLRSPNSSDATHLLSAASPTFDSDDESDADDFDDDDDDDDDFYEDDDDDEEVGEEDQGPGDGATAKQGKKRAGTARPDRYHKFDASQGAKKKIKQLREIQEKNRLVSRPRESHERTGTARPSNPNKQEDLESLNSDSSSDDFSANQFASTRDQTVRVNVARKPLVTSSLEKKTAVTTTNNIPPLEELVMNAGSDKSPSPSTLLQRRFQTFASSNSLHADKSATVATNTNSNTTDKEQSQSQSQSQDDAKSTLSEREKRIADMVKKMKDKQVQHEKRKTLFDNMKSYFLYGGIGGAAILASGVFLYYYLGYRS